MIDDCSLIIFIRLFYLIRFLGRFFGYNLVFLVDFFFGIDVFLIGFVIYILVCCEFSLCEFGFLGLIIFIDRIKLLFLAFVG